MSLKLRYDSSQPNAPATPMIPDTIAVVTAARMKIFGRSRSFSCR